MALTTTLLPNFFVTPATSMTKSEVAAGAAGMAGRSGNAGQRPALLDRGDVDGLPRMKVARPRRIGEHRLDHEDEFRAVIAVVENGRGVFRLRRKKTHAGLRGRVAAIERDAHRVAGFQRGELRLV